jgi:aryl-alcohol dehydrogenase-like predicted oxidoreductase
VGDARDPRHPGLDRRTFLKAGAGAALLPLLGGGVASAVLAAEEPPRIRRTTTLGRTGLRISDIGFGSSRLAGDVRVVEHAFERGVRYFDTAESYQGGASEETLGKALAGKRDQVVIASKVEAGASDPWPRLMTRLDGSLARLRTDRIDVYLNHAVNDVARLENPEWPELVSRAKQAGKIRSSGMSGHGGNLVECLDFALAHDRADVILVGYNFGQDPGFLQEITKSFDFVAVQPGLPKALERAKAKDVGVVAMKTLRGAKLNDLRPYEQGGATFAQAAFRWTLSNPNVDALVVTMTSVEQVDEYVAASGSGPPTRADVALLARYEALHGATQCRYGCSDCAGACPVGVSIPDVLRARMYAEDYGAPDLARAEFWSLGAASAPCLSCRHRACSGACPHGLDVAELATRGYRAMIG